MENFASILYKYCTIFGFSYIFHEIVDSNMACYIYFNTIQIFCTIILNWMLNLLTNYVSKALLLAVNRVCED